MRKIIMLITFFVITAAMFTSCYGTYKSDTNVSIGTTVSVESEVEDSSSNTIMNEKTVFNNLSFDQTMGVDRFYRTFDSAHIISGDACKGTGERAVCIATVEKIDKDGCISERGKFLPITLRIDTVIESTSAFSLRADDTVTVAECSTWVKNEEGYTVQYLEGIIPITEEGSQYILYVYEAVINERDAKFFWPDLQYRAEALTIPFGQNYDLTDAEIYEILKLPEDVIQCSEALIEHFLK